MSKTIEIRPYVWQGPYARWRSDAPHDPGLCAEIHASWMACGERLIARTCEMIGYPQGYLYDDHYPPAEPDGRGKYYQHVSFQWNTEQAPRRLFADCSVAGKARFHVALTGEADCVDIELGLHNDSGEPLGPIDWPFCMIALESPTFRNPEHDRIFIFDGKQLRSFRQINGKAGVCLISVVGGEGFVPVVHQSLPHSPVEAKESVIIIQGASGRKMAALGFQQSYSSFGCTGNMCFHMDPWFGILKPGEHKEIRGRLYLMDGSIDDALVRYRQDFPKKAADEQI